MVERKRVCMTLGGRCCKTLTTALAPVLSASAVWHAKDSQQIHPIDATRLSAMSSNNHKPPAKSSKVMLTSLTALRVTVQACLTPLSPLCQCCH